MTDPADSIQTYRQMLELDRRSRVFSLLAEELCAAGQWAEAAEVCKRGLLFHPDHLRSRVLLGWALMEMDDIEQAERILFNIVEDIRRNSVIFKLLSGLAAISGNSGSADEYVRIYEMFQHAGSSLSEETDPLPEPPSVSPIVAAAELDEVSSEAIEDLKAGIQEIDSLGTYPQPASVTDAGRKLSLNTIMMNLAERIEQRSKQTIRSESIFTEEDKVLLKEHLIAAVVSHN